jgi:hypothetical protein
MDKLIEYPKLIKRILTEYVELCRHPQPDIETFLLPTNKTVINSPILQSKI